MSKKRKDSISRRDEDIQTVFLYNRLCEDVTIMIESKKKWFIQQPNDQLVKQLQTELHISSIAAKILVARGCTTATEAQRIMKVDASNLHDPFLLHGMTEAIERIEEALMNEEKILIYGDYDADGITSSAVMLNVLLDLGADVDICIPNRFTHGYGPNEELFRQAFEKGTNLIITVDNGISGIEPIRMAKELGMDVIVTDHHEAGDKLPNADIIIHPRVPEGHYPFDDLAGVGVAFKLAHALYGEVPEHLFEFAAVGTIADLVPLVGENRYIVQKGLEQLRKSQNPWVRALCEASGVNQHEIDEEVIGFYFGPRLNAVGRLGDARPGVEFLMSENEFSAQNGAHLLNAKNVERKELVKQMTEEAIQMIEGDEHYSNSLVLVLAKEDWHAGVVGIVASRLVEKYYKPTIILSIDREKGVAKGSARSIEGFHLYNELAKNRDILPHFGGHPMAAGMTLQLEHVEQLRARLNEQARSCLTGDLLTPKLVVDVPVELSEMTVEAIDDIKALGPFGMGFEKPVFVVQNVHIKSMRKIGAAENHLKMELEDAHGSVDAIGFNKGYLHDEITFGVKLSFVGDVQINEWQGRKKPQFMIADVQTDEWQLFDLRGKVKGNQWLHSMPTEKMTYIAFDQETKQVFNSLIETEIQLADEIQSGESPYIVLLDLPKSVDSIERVITTLHPKRIYTVFYTAKPEFFNGMPSREHFSWYYTFLKKRPSFNLQMHLQQLSSHIGLSTEVIKFMTNVFFELGFVTIEGGLTTVNNHAPKRALSDASTYTKRVQQLEIEQLFLYATYSELKKWFDDRIKILQYT